MGGRQLATSGFGTVQLASYCEQGNKPLGFIKRWELLGHLKNCWI
jgi:hypothetical protein